MTPFSAKPLWTHTSVSRLAGEGAAELRWSFPQGKRCSALGHVFAVDRRALRGYQTKAFGSEAKTITYSRAMPLCRASAP